MDHQPDTERGHPTSGTTHGRISRCTNVLLTTALILLVGACDGRADDDRETVVASSRADADDDAIAPASPPTQSREPFIAPSTEQMRLRLEAMAAAMNPGVDLSSRSSLRAEYFDRQAKIATEQGPRIAMQVRAAVELLRGGRNEDALAAFDVVGAALAALGQRPLQLIDLRATTHLRIAEADNCLAQHGPESCLLPITGSGIHENERGSRAAIGEIEQMLEFNADDTAARWLLNLAHMTLGQYPDEVPEAWRIDPSVFTSPVEMRRFANVAHRAGFGTPALAGGAATDDFNGDGLLDVVVTSWGLVHPMQYFENNGDGTFSERADEAGLSGELGGLNINHVDYDNDGHLDIFVLRGGWYSRSGEHPNSLIRNRGDGTFEDVTVAAGLLTEHPTQTAVWGDFDNDGWADLFVGNETTAGSTPHPCEFFRNRGDGTFEEIAGRIGLDIIGFVKGSAGGDYDNDGRLDLYLSRFGQPNLLLRNVGAESEWRFEDVTAIAGVSEPETSFPTWFFDFDNDGHLDIFVAPFPGFTGDNLAAIAADYLGEDSTAERPRLYRSRGDGTFEDVTLSAGLDDPMLAMGANFGDIDNDGWLDIYVGTGEPKLHTLVPNRMYRNDAGRGFQNATFSGGFGHLQKGHGIAFADLDGDGDQDVFANMGGAYEGDLACNALFENPGNENHWITLRLVGVDSARSAIGGRIRVILGDGREIHRVVGTGGSFGSSSLQQEIGLGDRGGEVVLEVHWPASGVTQRFEAVSVDQACRIREDADAPEPTPLAGFEF